MRRSLRIARHAAAVAMVISCLSCGSIRTRPADGTPLLEVLVTDSPFAGSVGERSVVDRRGIVRGGYGPQSFELKGPSAGDRIRLTVQLDRMVQISGEVQGERTRRSFSVRYPVSLAVRGGRLWLGSDYVHLDSGRSSCFPTMAPGPEDKGNIWLGATVRPYAPARDRDGVAVAEQTSKTFGYDVRTGGVELVLPRRLTYFKHLELHSRAATVRVPLAAHAGLDGATRAVRGRDDEPRRRAGSSSRAGSLLRRR